MSRRNFRKVGSQTHALSRTVQKSLGHNIFESFKSVLSLTSLSFFHPFFAFAVYRRMSPNGLVNCTKSEKKRLSYFRRTFVVLSSSLVCCVLFIAHYLSDYCFTWDRKSFSKKYIWWKGSAPSFNPWSLKTCWLISVIYSYKKYACMHLFSSYRLQSKSSWMS